MKIPLVKVADNFNQEQNLELTQNFLMEHDRFDLIKFVVDWQLAKKRAGTSSSKGLSEVNGSTAKPHRQKGTGRARLGSRYVTQMRGGGIVFGPKPRSYLRKVNKKVMKLALKSIVSYSIKNNKLFFFSDEEFGTDVKTAKIANSIKNFDNQGKKILLVWKKNSTNESFIKSVTNIKGIKLLNIDGLNVYSLFNSDTILIDKACVENLQSKLLD